MQLICLLLQGRNSQDRRTSKNGGKWTNSIIDVKRLENREKSILNSVLLTNMHSGW